MANVTFNHAEAAGLLSALHAAQNALLQASVNTASRRVAEACDLNRAAIREQIEAVEAKCRAALADAHASTKPGPLGDLIDAAARHVHAFDHPVNDGADAERQKRTLRALSATLARVQNLT